MNKKIIVGLSLISSVYAATALSSLTSSLATQTKNVLKTCNIISSEDATKNAEYTSDANRCFNAYDIPFKDFSNTSITPVSLSTKEAGKDFILRIVKKPTCNVSNVTYSLVDKITGNTIPNTSKTITNPVEENFVQFNVDNSYKDVEVKFSYTKTTPSTTPTEVACPTNPIFVHNASEVTDKSAIFAIPNRYEYCYTFTKTWFSSYFKYTSKKVLCPTNPKIVTKEGSENTSDIYGVVKDYKCYQYKPNTTSKTETSTDDFAIKPNKFDITLKKPSIKVGMIEPMDLKVVDENDNITTNYKTSSVNLIVTFNPNSTQAKYAFDIDKGVLVKGFLSFLSANDDVSMKVLDEHYTDTDKDDTKQNCRNIEGTSNEIDIIDGSKYWAGAGTNESENAPAKNNINSDIRQNTKKDVHFQKMGW